MSEIFPLDFEGLEKGDVVPCEKIERIYQISHLTDPLAYQLKTLALSKQISDERPDLLARVEGLTVRVMTDLEAEEWTHAQATRAVASIARNARRRAVIDRSEFSEEEKRVAESRDRTITALALMTRKELARARRDELLLKPKKQDEDEEGEKQ
jgi:hypothetical protein